MNTVFDKIAASHINEDTHPRPFSKELWSDYYTSAACHIYN